LGVIARQQGRELAELAKEAGAAVIGGSSLKAALDRDWDNPEERAQALSVVLGALTAVERWLDGQPEGHDAPPIDYSLKAAHQVKQQDVESTADGKASLRKGVAKDRRISIEDAQMRHGRKSRSVRVDGDIRHVLQDLDSGLVRAVGITMANAAEASVTDGIRADLAWKPGTGGRTAHRPSLLEQHLGARTPCRVGDLLQGLASTQRPALPQDGL
jgi:hypothetical protein